MSFTGKEGEQITLQEGAVLTKRYRDKNPGSTKGVFYGKAHIEALLAQSGCMGIRMYFAEEADGDKTLVHVGVDAAGNDMLNMVVENGLRCPAFCSDANVLNSGTEQR